jgi:hypothetical protein
MLGAFDGCGKAFLRIHNNTSETLLARIFGFHGKDEKAHRLSNFQIH